MLDPARLRSEPDRLREKLAAKGHDTARFDDLIRLDTEHRAALHRLEELRAEKNRASRAIAEAKRSGGDTAEAVAAMKDVGRQESELEQESKRIHESFTDLLMVTPNDPDDDVPVGTSEEENRLVRTWGEPAEPDNVVPHWEIAERLQIMDTERGGRTSGSRFFYLSGDGALLERSLADWLISTQIDNGYRELRVPLLVKPHALVGSSQLPKFAEDMYYIGSDDSYLIPTAEVPLINYHREEILPEEELPLSYTAVSANFRREAGAAGRQTRGLVRGHQFYKVEMVTFSRPEDSAEDLEKMVTHAEGALQKLGLTYRVVLVCTGEMTFSNARQYDIEVWAPGLGEWLEVSSVSNCRDFQARRAKIRCKAGKEKPRPVHILNGTALGVPRTMAAILEQFQQPDGSVLIPEVLRDRFSGRQKLSPKE